MKASRFLFALVAAGLAAGSQAAQVTVEWQSPQQFTDIGSNDGSQDKFRAALFGALDAVFAEQAAQLSGPPSIDGISDVAGVPTYCEVADRKRREGSDWASKRLA